MIVIALHNVESFQIFGKINSLIAFESPISDYTIYYTALVKKMVVMVGRLPA